MSSDAMTTQLKWIKYHSFGPADNLEEGWRTTDDVYRIARRRNSDNYPWEAIKPGKWSSVCCRSLEIAKAYCQGDANEVAAE